MKGLRDAGIRAACISDLPAVAVLVSQYVASKISGMLNVVPREAAAIKIITNFVEEDLMKSRAVTSLEQQAIGSFLSIIIRKVVHSPMTVLLLKKLEEREGEELVDVKINMKKKEKKKKSNSQQKPILNRSASLGSPVMKKELDDMLLPTSKDTISIAKEQKREGGYTIYKGLEHNPYVGTIRHAPNVDEIKDLADKVFETVMKQKWVPMKDPLVSDIIPLAARVLQLVSFEAGFGRDGEVNEEEVSIDIMHRVVEDLLPWKTEEDLYRARNLMMTAVPDAISKRLNLSTIEAIVASSEQQIMRRKLEEGIPYMAVMGLESRIKCEGECAELVSKARKLDNIIFTIHLLYSTMVALIPEFLVGYNTAVMNSPEAFVFPGHSTVEWSLAVSVFAIGGPFGALAGGIFANVYGRKNALRMNMLSFLIGGVMQTFAPGMVTIIIARALIGFASGFATVLVPVYIGELAPPALRGTFGTMSQLSMVSGILAASIASLWFTTAEGWRYLFGVTPLLSSMSLYWLSGVKESPRWLYSHSELPRMEVRLATAKLLMELRGFRDEQQVGAELTIFEDAIRRQKTQHRSAHGLGAMTDLVCDPDLRVSISCLLVLQLSQQFCGINAVFYYSTKFLSGAVSDPLVGTVIISAVNVGATYLAAQIMDDFPRRGLLIFSSVGMALACLGITFALDDRFPIPIFGRSAESSLALISTGLYVIMFEIGLGPIPWLISSEMFDVKNVATAQSVASQLNWICNFIVGFSFPFLQTALDGLTFVPFAVVLVLTTLFVQFYVPETSGHTSEQFLKANAPAAASMAGGSNASISTVEMKKKKRKGSLKQQSSSSQLLRSSILRRRRNSSSDASIKQVDDSDGKDESCSETSIIDISKVKKYGSLGRRRSFGDETDAEETECKRRRRQESLQGLFLKNS